MDYGLAKTANVRLRVMKEQLPCWPLKAPSSPGEERIAKLALPPGRQEKKFKGTLDSFSDCIGHLLSHPLEMGPGPIEPMTPRADMKRVIGAKDKIRDFSLHLFLGNGGQRLVTHQAAGKKSLCFRLEFERRKHPMDLLLGVIRLHNYNS